MQTVYLKSVTRPDGYFGKRTLVHLCYDPESQRTLEVHPMGWHGAIIPQCVDAKEAAWMLEHYPACKGHYK